MAEKLAASGAEIVHISIPEVFESFRAFVFLFGAEGFFHFSHGELDKYLNEYSSSLILLSTFARTISPSAYMLVCANIYLH